MKYLIYEHNGLEVPIIFPVFINHCDMAHKVSENNEIISAGFCNISENKLNAFGKSQSLQLKSGEHDSILLNLMLKG